MEHFNVKHWDYFKHCVKELKIPPSEAWGLDILEVAELSDQQPDDMDLTFMLNYERTLNGASKEWLQKHS